MPKNPHVKKVVVIGSGPIVIGQAAEFDYAGTQACRSLREEGICVVLINSNPATIMTDKDIADKVYIEPLTPEVVKAVIKKEKPDSVLPTLGGQAALNIAMELEESGFLKEHNVRLLGTSSKTIKKAEDRLEFKKTMEKIHEPCAPSEVVTNIKDGLAFVEKIGYPIVLRPAYTLGGSGGGIAHNEEEFVEILMNGLRLSRVVRYWLSVVSRAGKRLSTRLCVMRTVPVLPYVIWRIWIRLVSIPEILSLLHHHRHWQIRNTRCFVVLL